MIEDPWVRIVFIAVGIAALAFLIYAGATAP
jgi:uncharacterized membrane protein YuzA (DUF378 family)